MHTIEYMGSYCLFVAVNLAGALECNRQGEAEGIKYFRKWLWMPLLTRFPLSEVLTKLPQGNLKEKGKGKLFAFHPILVQLLSHVQLFVTPWTAARQAPLSSTISQSWLKFMSTESAMLFNHLILHPLLLSIFPSIRVFSNIRCNKRVAPSRHN